MGEIQSRTDHRYVIPVVITLVGGVAYIGPWAGYWEIAGAVMFVGGAVLWSLWELIIQREQTDAL